MQRADSFSLFSSSRFVCCSAELYVIHLTLKGRKRLKVFVMIYHFAQMYCVQFVFVNKCNSWQLN